MCVSAYIYVYMCMSIWYIYIYAEVIYTDIFLFAPHIQDSSDMYHTVCSQYLFTIVINKLQMCPSQFNLSRMFQFLRRVLPCSCDPLPSLGELSSSSLNRMSVCLLCLFWLCIPPVVYGRHILCLRCLRVAFFSEKKRGVFIFFSNSSNR